MCNVIVYIYEIEYCTYWEMKAITNTKVLRVQNKLIDKILVDFTDLD